MYSLDINFLKDRPEYQKTEKGSDSPKRAPMGNMTPLILGVVVGLLLPGIVGGLWLFLQQQNSQLQENITEVDAKLQALEADKKKITDINNDIKRVNEETEALATVFNQIKPWSAILQDIRERIPANVQIKSIEQIKVEQASAAQPSPSPSPQASASPSAGAPTPSTPILPIHLQITGQAKSFDDVNYFLLTLQRSPFFKEDETQLVNAELVKNPNKLEVPVNNAQNETVAKKTYELPKSVQYQIATTLTDASAEELLRELDRKGAVGLVTRIRTLQRLTEEAKTQNATETTTQTTKE